MTTKYFVAIFGSKNVIFKSFLGQNMLFRSFSVKKVNFDHF